MKLFSAFILSLVLISGWETDFEDAKKKADKEHKMVLLSFSGSDWCIPCIQMHKEIFDAPAFTDFAENNLVLVNADFPRLGKHQLSKDAVKKNEKLADKYNKDGIFPYTVLLDADGKVVKTWEGYPRVNAEQFTSQLKDLLNAGKSKE